MTTAAKPLLCFACLLLFCGLMVGSAAAATETLTVVYCADQSTYPFSTTLTVSGTTFTGITVKDSSNNYWRYYPGLEASSPETAKVALGGTPSSKTWDTVNKLGQYDTNNNVLSGSDGYITSTGTQWINTNIPEVYARKSIIDFNFNTLSGGQRLDGYFYESSGNSYTCGWGVETSSNYFRYANPAASRYTWRDSTVMLDTERHIFTRDLISYKYAIDTYEYSVNSYIRGSNIYPCRLLAYGSDNYEAAAYSVGNLYSATYYDGDNNIIRYYIPIHYGSTYALYDNCLSNNVIYNNAGSGSFTGGGTETPLTYTHVSGPDIAAVTLTSSTPAPLSSAVTATVTATGTGTLSYVWHYSTDSGSTWTAISGQTTAALTFTPQTAGTYTLKTVVTDTGGSTDSYEAGFTSVIAVIVAPPVITYTPVATPAQGPLTQTVVLSIDTTGISGEGTLTYQWQEQLNSVWTNMPGSSSTVPYSASVTDAAAAVHTYRLVVSNVGGSTTSASVTYTSYAAPVFSSVSVGPTTSAVPATITFTATASDATSIVYQLSSNEITWSEITSPYVINQVGTYYFRALATGYGGTTYSESQTITVSDLIPVITSATASPTSGLVPFSVTFSANATNSPTYTWYKRVNGLDQQIGTGNPFVYQFTAGTAAGVQYFRVKAHNQYGDVFSPDISVTVGALPGTVITSPSSGSSYMQRQSITFTASSSSQFATTYSWVFSDGGTASGSSVTHTFQDYGAASATVAGTNQFGTDTATVQLEIFEYSAVAVSVSDISAKGATFTGLIGESVIDPTTTMHFEIMSKSGTVLWKTDDKLYSQSAAFTAEGMPLISGQQYRVKAVTNNYGNSQVISFTLNNASRTAPTPLGTVYESSGLNRDPFNITKLVDGSTAAFGEALGGGTVGKALCFGVIVLFLVVGLWLRQGDVIIPVTIGLAGGWFIIGNLPGEWQPIAYSLLVVSIVAIFWVIFKKRIE